MCKVLLMQTICSHTPLLAKVKSLFPETHQTCLQTGFVAMESTRPGPTLLLPTTFLHIPRNKERSWSGEQWMLVVVNSLQNPAEKCKVGNAEDFYGIRTWNLLIQKSTRLCSLPDSTPQTEQGPLSLGRTIRLLHLCPRKWWFAFMC